MRTLSKMIIIMLLFSCQMKTAENNRTEETSQKNADSNPLLNESEESISDGINPKVNFMIFFSNFMWDKEFQKERIVFPIFVNQHKIESKNEWKYIPFYTSKNYLPILQADTSYYFEKYISDSLLKMSILSFKNQKTDNYDFKNTQEGWKLVEVNVQPIDSLKDIGFINFLKQFSADSVFQTQHIVFPLANYHFDYESDYEILYDSLSLKEWRYLKIDSGLEGMLTLNINENSNYRVILLNGVENGIHVKYTFMKFKKTWRLIKSEDYST